MYLRGVAEIGDGIAIPWKNGDGIAIPRSLIAFLPPGQPARNSSHYVFKRGHYVFKRGSGNWRRDCNPMKKWGRHGRGIHFVGAGVAMP